MAGYEYITDNGIIQADTSDILQVVEGEWRGALGQKLNTASSTLQGTMIGTEAIARTSVLKGAAELANQMNPNFSYGTFLDANCDFLAIKRGNNKSTIIRDAQILGDPTTVINQGSRVQSINGDLFITATNVTIDVTGTATVDLTSVSFGNIAVPVGELRIVDGTIGWGSTNVTVDSTVVPGTLQLTDPQLKNQRNRRLATLGLGSTEAIAAAVLAVDNVTSVKVIENNTGAPGLIEGVQFTKNTGAWICVAGVPNKQDLANALYGAHQMSCPWDFGTSSGTPVDAPTGVKSVDPISGVGYFVKWTTPNMYDTYVIATVGNGTSAASPVQGVQNAIIDYSEGNIAGEEGFVVGASVSGYELAGAVLKTLPGLYVKSILIACVPAGSAAPAPSAYTSEFVMKPFWQAQIKIGNIQVISV